MINHFEFTAERSDSDNNWVRIISSEDGRLCELMFFRDAAFSGELTCWFSTNDPNVGFAVIILTEDDKFTAQVRRIDCSDADDFIDPNSLVSPEFETLDELAKWILTLRSFLHDKICD